MTRSFYTRDAYVETEIRPGLYGTVIDGERATVVRWVFAPHMVRTGIHYHDEHEQFGVVVSGQIELEINGIVSLLGHCELYYIPKGVPHGGTIVIGNEAAVVIDYFTPPREEYVRAANGGTAYDPVAGSR